VAGGGDKSWCWWGGVLSCLGWVFVRIKHLRPQTPQSY
jgi:hypothetical protein